MLTALRKLLDALGNDPFALLIEDLHWADPSTLELLELLAARGTRVPVMGTWRLHDDTTAPCQR